MIFVTVGTQLAFDRMIRVVDEWAGRAREDVFAQIGPGRFKPAHLRWKDFIGADEFAAAVREASAVIAHAGMGSILLALELGKPILVMPRRAALGEHRNDHQLATARRFLEQGRINVAFDEQELITKLDRLSELRLADRISSRADPRLAGTIAAFVRGEALRAGPDGTIAPAVGPSTTDSSEMAPPAEAPVTCARGPDS